MRCLPALSTVYAAGLLALIGAISAACPSFATTAPSASASTRKQIAAGIALYKERCVLCHSENLAGGAGPPLRGEDFVAQWEGKPLRSLYSRILMTMPGNDPGSLTPVEVLALVSYISSENTLAEWKTPFKSADDLTSIVVRKSK
jgi:mono/diheme cytochrome c family protein